MIILGSASCSIYRAFRAEVAFVYIGSNTPSSGTVTSGGPYVTVPEPPAHRAIKAKAALNARPAHM